MADDLKLSGALFSTGKLWQVLYDTYYTLNSGAALEYVESRLSPTDQDSYFRGIAYFNAFLGHLAKATRHKLRLDDSKLPRYVRAKNVGALLRMKMDSVSRLVLARQWKLNFESLINRFLTRRSFNHATTALSKAQARFKAVSWREVSQTLDQKNIQLQGMQVGPLSKLLSLLSVTAICEILLPQVNNQNMRTFMDALARVPKRAYDQRIIDGLMMLIASDRVYISANAPLRRNSVDYWGNMPRAKARALFQTLDATSLKKVAPFLALTVDELQSLQLTLTPAVIASLGASRHPAARSFWIASRLTPVAPALYIYNKRGYRLSSFEKNLLGLFNGDVNLARGRIGSVVMPGWQWFEASQVDALGKNVFKRFAAMVQPYAFDTEVQLAGAFLKGTTYVVFYSTVYGNLATKRKEADVISFFIYDRALNRLDYAFTDPRTDSPFGLRDITPKVKEAINLGSQINLSSQAIQNASR